jgi:hypothetical protein
VNNNWASTKGHNTLPYGTKDGWRKQIYGVATSNTTLPISSLYVCGMQTEREHWITNREKSNFVTRYFCFTFRAYYVTPYNNNSNSNNSNKKLNQYFASENFVEVFVVLWLITSFILFLADWSMHSLDQFYHYI